MTQAESLRIDLEPDTADLVRQAVASGAYKDASEVVSQALQAWARKDLLGYNPAEIARLADEGIASGPGRFATTDEIRMEILRRVNHPRQDG